MPIHSQPDQLSEMHYVTVILRLLIDKQGRLAYGQVVDLEGRSLGWFSGWQGLVETLRHALDRLEDEDAMGASP